MAGKIVPYGSSPARLVTMSEVALLDVPSDALVGSPGNPSTRWFTPCPRAGAGGTRR
jgi:hypothetical protein